MNPAEFSQRLLETEPGSPEAGAIAYELLEDARFPATFALQYSLTSSNKAEQMKGMQVLAELGELALAPLAQSASSLDVDTEMWALRTMTDEFLDFRARVASVLKGLLSSRRRAARLPEGVSSFQPPPGARICDLAFVMLHRTLNLDLQRSSFLSASPHDRDERIAEFQKSRAFRAAFEGYL